VSFLASLGLLVFGVELSIVALRRAQERMSRQPAHISRKAHFVQTDVSSLPFGNLGVCYVLDIGCFHTVPRAHRTAYAQGVIGNLAPGGFYHLYAHDTLQAALDKNEDDRGLEETEVADLFAPELSLVAVLRGQPDPRPCRWYLLQKPR
jgi:hypothetical protein